MKKYKMYLFDYDYTIANSEQGIVGSFEEAFRINGYNDIDLLDIKKTIGMPLLDAFSLLTGVKDEKILQKYYDDFTVAADEIMTKRTVLYPGTEEMLKRVRSFGAVTGIVSTKPKRRIDEFLITNHYDGLFDIILGLHEVKNPKPDPEGILYLIDRFGMGKEDVLYVGDSIIDAKCGMNAGVDFAAITNGTTKADEFIPYPHVAIMKSFDEI